MRLTSPATPTPSGRHRRTESCRSIRSRGDRQVLPLQGSDDPDRVRRFGEKCSRRRRPITSTSGSTAAPTTCSARRGAPPFKGAYLNVRSAGRSCPSGLTGRSVAIAARGIRTSRGAAGAGLVFAGIVRVAVSSSQTLALPIGALRTEGTTETRQATVSGCDGSSLSARGIDRACRSGRSCGHGHGLDDLDERTAKPVYVELSGRPARTASLRAAHHRIVSRSARWVVPDLRANRSRTATRTSRSLLGASTRCSPSSAPVFVHTRIPSPVA